LCQVRHCPLCLPPGLRRPQGRAHVPEGRCIGDEGVAASQGDPDVAGCGCSQQAIAVDRRPNGPVKEHATTTVYWRGAERGDQFYLQLVACQYWYKL
jgi:hypothetical protein